MAILHFGNIAFSPLRSWWLDFTCIKNINGLDVHITCPSPSLPRNVLYSRPQNARTSFLQWTHLIPNHPFFPLPKKGAISNSNKNANLFDNLPEREILWVWKGLGKGNDTGTESNDKEKMHFKKDCCKITRHIFLVFFLHNKHTSQNWQKHFLRGPLWSIHQKQR